MQLCDTPSHLAPPLDTAGRRACYTGNPLAVAATHGEYIVTIDKRSHVMHQKVPASANLIGEGVISKLSENPMWPLRGDRNGASVPGVLSPLTPILSHRAQSREQTDRTQNDRPERNRVAPGSRYRTPLRS